MTGEAGGLPAACPAGAGGRNADQKHRWLARSLLDIEPRLRKVRGDRHLPRLRAALEAHAKGPGEQVA